MTPWQLEVSWAGYAALGRRMAFGRTMIGRSLGGLAAALGIGMTAAIALAEPRAGIEAALVVACALVAGCYSLQATGTAARAQRIFVLAMAPSATLFAWRRGWLQAQIGIGLALAAPAIAIVALRAGASPGLILIAGLIGASQAIGAWTALALQGRAGPGALLAPWLAAATLAIVLERRWPWTASADVAGALGTMALAAAVAALVVARRRLGPLPRIGRTERPATPLSALRRLLVRWTPIGDATPRSLWRPLITPLGLLAYGSLMATTYLPLRLVFVAYVTAACSSTLVIDKLHWRHRLLPGAAQRSHLGRQIVATTLGMFALAVAPCILIAAVLAWIGGVPADALAAVAGKLAILLVELTVGTAAATLLNALFMGRLGELRSWLIIAAAAIVVIAAALVLRPWRPDSPCAGWPRVGLGYALVLLPVGLACVALADRLWARRDLAALMRRPRKRWSTALGY